MVLRHTTGLPNWGNDAGVQRRYLRTDSTFSIRARVFYFLQRLVEKLTKKPLNELMQQDEFTPLGMNNSSYTWIDKFDTVAAFGNSAEMVNRHKNQKCCL